MVVFATPTSSGGGDVLSVAGRTGHVVLAQADIAGLVSDLAGKEPAIVAGTTAQYWRGDKSWQTLNAAAVGLSAVTNNAQLKIASNLSDLNSAATARTNLGLGSIATQASNNVSISGGSINVTGLQLNGTTVSVVGHTHSEYSPTSHNHSGVYSPVGHDHSGVYAAVTHYHDMEYINGLGTALSGKADAGDLSTVAGDLSSHVGSSSIHAAINDSSTSSSDLWSASKINTELASKLNKTSTTVSAAVSLVQQSGFTPSNAVFEVVGTDGTTVVAKVTAVGNLVATNHVEVAGFEDVPTSGNVTTGIKVYARPVMVAGPLVGWRMRGANSGNCSVKVSKIAANGTTITELYTATMTAAQVASGTVSHALAEDEWIQLEVTGTPTVTGVTFALMQRRGA